MTGTAWPVVVNRLVALLPTLTGWSAIDVHDGPPVSLDNLSYCVVGSTDNGPSGSYRPTRGGDGWTVEESGSVSCRLVIEASEEDIAASRATAALLMDALSASILTDQTLGVLRAGSTTELNVSISALQNQQGSAQTLDFTVNYFARQ